VLTVGAVLRLAARGRLATDALLAVFAVVTALQAGALLWRFRRQTLSGLGARLRRPLRPGYFGAALPFFLLGLSGMLQSRVDLYVANALLPRAGVGHYQVVIGFLLYLQALANALLLPFVKSLYRVRAPAVPLLAARLGLAGLAVVPPSILGLRWLLGMLYGVELPAAAWVWGGLLAWPAYLYLPLVYWLYRLNRPGVVLGLNLLGTAVSAGLSLYLMPRVGIGGGLAAAAAAQWAMLGAYLLLARQWRQAADAVAVPDVP
jgi:O-antigen/teichoic acid export membrane protein